MNSALLQKLSCVGICGIDIPGGANEFAGCDAAHDVIRCESGETFRKLMAAEPSLRSAVLGSDIDDVDPLNLVAALKKDCPERLVFTLDSDWGLSLSDNAARAGVDASVALDDLHEALGVPDQMAKPEPDTCGSGEMARISEQVGESDGTGGICVSIVSGRGGVGKSTLSLVLALVAASHGVRCVVVDADLQFGDLAFLCNDDRAFTTIGFDAGDAAPRVDPADGKATPVVHSVAGPEYSEVLAPIIERFVLECRKRFDLVLVNTGSFWTDLHADLMKCSDGVVLVMDMRATSVRGCLAARDLCMRLGIPTSKLFYVLNRCSREMQIGMQDCAITLGVDAGSIISLPDGGMQLDEAMSLGIPSSLLDSDNPLVASAEQALAAIMSKLGSRCWDSSARPEAREGRKWLFGRRSGHVSA